MNGANRSIGIGRSVVVLCSLEISFIVCQKRSCRAIASFDGVNAKTMHVSGNKMFSRREKNRRSNLDLP
jgi:hypothetical protein